MALALHAAPSISASTALRRLPPIALVLPAFVLLLCAVLMGRLVASAMSDSSTVGLASAAAPVDIQASGTLTSAGLASGGSTVSAFTLTNNGDQPVRWSARSTTTGTPGVADRLQMTVAAAGAAGCTAATTPLTLGSPSPAALAPGQSTQVCVTMTMPGTAAAQPGTVTPGVTFVAVPA